MEEKKNWEGVDGSWWCGPPGGALFYLGGGTKGRHIKISTSKKAMMVLLL